MKKIVLVGILFLAAAPWISAQPNESAKLSGPCLGQKPPGMTPEIFAPGVVSRDGIQMKLTMSADGSNILYTERDPATNAASFIIRSRAGESWGETKAIPELRTPAPRQSGGTRGLRP